MIGESNGQTIYHVNIDDKQYSFVRGYLIYVRNRKSRRKRAILGTDYFISIKD